MGDDSGSTARQALQAIRRLQEQLDALNEPVAIVGMGCRYPGAESLGEFWELLAGGVDAVTEVPAERWDLKALFNPEASVPGRMVSRWGGFLKKLDEFDADFFGITPREAPYVDPRQRLMLEITWEALEAAGIAPETLAGSRTGVFIATLTNDYDHLLFQDLRRAEAYSGSGTANSIVANRISYFLDLKGPSLAIDTACSGSLVAIHMACESLRKAETALALAGGVNLNLMPKSSVFFSKAGALSPSGRCRTFDAAADGIVRSDGAGVLVLKLLSRAQRDGDPVIAVIRGSAINHDGRSNGIMAPNGEAQIAVLRSAYERAGVSPAEVQYVEAHGTGTKLGDPIEVSALAEALAPGRNGRCCRLGSVKTNIGHSEAAAGVAGVIKTALALHHRLLPPSLHYNAPNPLIPFSQIPFDVQTELGPWPYPAERLTAGVSAFGFGGTNAHVVLREAPTPNPAQNNPEPPFILPISARSREGLAQLAAGYSDLLRERGDAAGVCYSAARRGNHSYRIAVTGNDAAELRAGLEQRTPPQQGTQRPRTALIFSGQGSQWRGMGEGLYRHEPAFRSAMDECAALFRELAGWELLDEIRGERLDATSIAQPAIFAVQIALAALWRSWGILPDVVAGHSLGEAAAAHTAGALSLTDAVRVVFHRSRLMKRVEGKGRTAVIGVPPDHAARLIAGREDLLAVAGSNGPDTSVLSGETEALQKLVGSLAARNVFCRLIPGVEIAFHSPQMDALAPELECELASITPRAAQVPLISTVTGTWIEGERLDAHYWARNMREPFLFTQASGEALAAGCGVLLEVSPHAVLSSSMAQTVRRRAADATVVSSLRRDEDEIRSMLSSLAALYEQGHAVNWQSVYPAGRRVRLPDYPWQRRRYWFDQLGGGHDSEGRRDVHPLLGEGCEPALGSETMRVWECTLDLKRLAYLDDHKFEGEAILPGAAYLEMAHSAALQVWPGKPVAVWDAVFERPLRITPEPAPRIQTTLVIRDGESEFSIFSRSESGAWVRNATGKAGPYQERAARSADPVDAPGATEEASVESHYAAFHSRGLEYGDAFRGIERLWRGEGDAVAEIKISAALHDPRYGLHPAAIDAAIQVIAAALPDRAGTYLPVGAMRWLVFGGADAFRCRARVRASDSGALEADLDLRRADGVTVARLEGLTLAPVRTSPLSSALIEEVWEPRQITGSVDNTGRWALLGAASQLREALLRRGQTAATELDESVTDVIHIGEIETALQAAQKLLRAAPQARLWLVSDGSIERSPVEGFALSAALEHPELRPTLVRLEEGAGIEQLMTEVLRGGDEPRVSWRGAERFVSRLRRVPAPPSSEAALSGNATYLITGGSGSLGLATARLLAELGARHLALVSRSPKAVEIPGAEVLLISADIGATAGADCVFEALRSMPPLKGVIHAAGVLDDGLISDQSPERFRRVLAPKALGARHLNERTANLDLDFFVMFSSAASLIGSSGQSNYAAANAYMDALAHERRKSGLPSLSLNWGAWAGGGMASGTVRRMAARGVDVIAPSDGLRLLGQLLRRESGDSLPAALGVFPVDWPVFLGQVPEAAMPRFERFIVQRPAAVMSFHARLERASRSEQPALLNTLLHETLASVLGFGDGARIAPQQRFFDLGMDSLMTLEFRNRLESELKLGLPATLAFDHPSLESLSRHLSGVLFAEEAHEPGAGLRNLSEKELATLLAQEIAGDPDVG